jgi:hypothetical protein
LPDKINGDFPHAELTKQLLLHSLRPLADTPRNLWIHGPASSNRFSHSLHVT